MKWFADLKIGRKLGLGFGVLGVLIILVGVQGVRTAQMINGLMSQLHQVHAVPSVQLKEAQSQVLRRARAVRDALLDDDRSVLEGRVAEFARYDSAFTAEFGAYRQRITLAETRAQAERLDAIINDIFARQDRILQHRLAGEDSLARASLLALRSLNSQMDALLDTLITTKLGLMERSAASGTQQVKSAVMTLTILIVVALAIALVAGFGITRPIVRSLTKLGNVADGLAVGDLDHTLDITSKDEMGGLANSMQRMVDSQKALAAAAVSISAGDVSVSVAARSDKDVLGRAFVHLRDTVQHLIDETTALVTAAKAGMLETRGDVSRFDGAFRTLVQGINDTLHAVVTPIREASDVLARVAERDLTARITGSYDGDFATIKHSINAATSTLDEALAQVHVAAAQVATAGQQIAGGSQSLAQGSSEQAASLEEVSSSLHEMTQSTTQTAANARHALSIAETARGKVADGRRSMDQLSSAIDQIKNSSDQTARIVKTIDEIAFQTNLLALNAAVEAARAGDAGRGFAVVAEEVRTLAIRSAEAARTTASLIEESVNNAQSGVSLNRVVLENLSEIDAQVGRVSGVVSEIATAGEQQRDGVEQINVAVTQLNAVTQQVAANAEESASASEELAGQSLTLTNLVETFRISETRPDRRHAVEDLGAAADEIFPPLPTAPAGVSRNVRRGGRRASVANKR